MAEFDRIICGNVKTNELYFFDYINEEELSDLRKYPYEIYGSLNYDCLHSFHTCKHSAIWEDVTGIIDKLQKEESLPDNKRYVVCYYEADKNYDLLQKVDWNITKQDIINNVLAQKYFEGADYYLMEDFSDE